MALLAHCPPASSYLTAAATLCAALWVQPAAAARRAALPQDVVVSPTADLQALSCWVDPPDFFGTTVRYVRRDGKAVEERIGFGSGDRILHSFHNEMTVCLKVHGEVSLGAGGRIVAMPLGSWLMMSGRDSARSVELRVSPAPSGLTYAWSVDGVPTPFAEEADALLALAAEYWPYFQRVADANAEIRRIARELAVLASAREDQRLRAIAQLEAERTRERERVLAELANLGLGTAAIITQDASSIRITQRTNGGELTAVYNTDGSTSRNLLTFGGETIEQVARASWEGDRVVITSSLELNGSALETRMSLAFDPNGRLVVESTAPGDGGVPVKATRRYRRSDL